MTLYLHTYLTSGYTIQSYKYKIKTKVGSANLMCSKLNLNGKNKHATGFNLE